MRKFVVEDRNSGSLVLEGEILADGSLNVLRSDLSSSDQDVVIAAVREDSANGFSGGQLPLNGLEWFEHA
jgi:hypothetical protein